MLHVVEGRHRQLRLFGCAWGRQHWYRIKDEPFPHTSRTCSIPLRRLPEGYWLSSMVLSFSRICSLPRPLSVLLLRRGISSNSAGSEATAEILASRSRCSIG